MVPILPVTGDEAFAQIDMVYRGRERTHGARSKLCLIPIRQDTNVNAKRVAVPHQAERRTRITSRPSKYYMGRE